MTAALVHRGPDGEGFAVDERRRVFLGHRRLAVLDIPGGAQPMWNEARDVAVVFNGEIYNHRELRAALVARGHVFRSDHSDTEVLVHGYEEWDEDLPSRLNGMFAFAIYDARRARLFLARDRFGEKPLFYIRRGDVFAFASEATAFARHAALSLEIAPAALAAYFAHGFVPAPRSLYRDVRKIPGGGRLTLDIATGTVRESRYWRFRIEADERLGARPEAELAEELRGLICQAVARRLESDVPLGVFLSGGLDSSAIVACAAERMAASDIRTFTIGFNEESFDETPYARAVAAHVGTSHHHEILSLERAMALVPDVLARMDEPIADPSIVPTHLLCAFARKRVVVALSGDGGDELFAGYDPFRALGPAAILDAILPRRIRPLLRAAAARLPVSRRNMSFDFRLRRFLAGLDHARWLWNPVWLGPLEPADIADLLARELDLEETYAETLAVWRESEGKDMIDRTLEFYTNFYLQDGILTKMDRASMMVSLEVRAPFLDVDLVEFARRLPHRYKLRHGSGKALLRRALRGGLPDAIIDRPKKGFGIPLIAWLDSLAPTPRAPDAARIDARKLACWWREHLAGRTDRRLFLWSMLALDQAAAGRA